MFGGLGMPIPYLSNKPGPGRPGWGPAGSYDFQFEVIGDVTIEAFPNTTGQSFTIKWQDGSTTQTSGSSTINSPIGAGAGIISINNELDNTYADEFKIVSGQNNVTKVISWGQNPWSIVEEAFKDCINLTDIGTTSFIAGTANVSNQASGCVMFKMFLGCTSLLEVDIRTWDLSTSGASWRLGGPFANLANLQKLDATGLKIKFFDSSNVSTFNFANIGTNVTDGCEFKMAGLDLSTSSTGYLDNLFDGTKFKAGSNLSNWKFPVNFNPAGWRGYGWFQNCILNDGILNVSGWTTWPGNMLPYFGNFNSALTSQGTAKVDLSNFGLTNVFDFSNVFNNCKLKEVIGFSTWGACAGNANIGSMFSSASLMRIDPSDNFSDTFIASLTPTNVTKAFQLFGYDLLDSQRGVTMNFNNIDLSNVGSFYFTWRYAKLLDAPDFSTATFDNNNPVSFESAFLAFNTLNADSSIVLNGGKITNFLYAFRGTTVNTVNIDNGVDLSALTTVAAMFYYSSVGTATLPSNADYSSLTNFGNFNTGFSGFSVCQGDILIRRLKATNLNTNITANLPKITESPALVNSDRDVLDYDRGWNIVTTSPDASLPFAYAEYMVDPSSATSLTPSTLPPVADRNFSSTNASITVNQTTGVLSWASNFEGFTTVRCTYADGCYNEVSIGVQVPFTMRRLIPAAGQTVQVGTIGNQYIDWGDGVAETNSDAASHAYSAAGTGFGTWRTIKIFDKSATEKFTGMTSSGAYYDRVNIIKWGSPVFDYLRFAGVYALGIRTAANDPLNTTSLTSFEQMFVSDGSYKTNARLIDPYNNLDTWKTSTATGGGAITTFKNMFANTSSLGQQCVNDESTFTFSFPAGTTATAGTYGSATSNSAINGRTQSGTTIDYSIKFQIIIDGSGTVTLDNTNTHVIPQYMYQGDNVSVGDVIRIDAGSFGSLNNNITCTLTSDNVSAGSGQANFNNWDTSQVTDFSSMFSHSSRPGGRRVQNVNFGNWNLSSATSFNTFCNIGNLSGLKGTDLTPKNVSAVDSPTGSAYIAWDTSNVTDFSSFCYLGDVPLGVLKYWRFNTANNFSMNAMFYNMDLQSHISDEPCKTQVISSGDSNNPFGADYTAWNMDKCSSVASFAYRQTSPPGLQVLTPALSSWQISDSLTSFSNFSRAYSGSFTFTPTVGAWDISGITGSQAFHSTRSGEAWKFSTSAYDNLLDITSGWGQHASTVNTGVTLNMGDSQYSAGNVVNITWFANTGTGVGANKLFATGFNLQAATSVGDIVYFPASVGSSSTAYARITGYVDANTATTTATNWTGGGTTQTFEIYDSNSAKGRFALLEAGWTIIDGGAYIPFDSTELEIEVQNVGDTMRVIFQSGTTSTHIDWGDGAGFVAVNTYFADSPGYSSTGTKTIKINETSADSFPGLDFETVSATQRLMLTKIKKWGTNPFSSWYRSFYGCTNITSIDDTASPNLSGTSSLAWAFSNMTGLTTFDFSNWSLPSSLTDLTNMFWKGHVMSNTSFNTLVGWDVSNIQSFSYTFTECRLMNANIANWDTSSATSLAGMFDGAYVFNQDISEWKTSNNTRLDAMFNNAFAFNQDVNTKVVGSGASAYIAWDTSNVEQWNGTFKDARAFNQPIDKWEIAKTSGSNGMTYMFGRTSVFNQDLLTKDVTIGAGTPVAKTYVAWDVSYIQTFGIGYSSPGAPVTHGMFESNTVFNGDISNWDIPSTNARSDGKIFNRMFAGATAFNKDLSQKTITNVTGKGSYDAWDISSVKELNATFQGASSFSQNLSNWQLKSDATIFHNVFRSTSMSTNNYTDTLVGWSNYVKSQTPDAPLNVQMDNQNGRTFDENRSGGANFANAFEARKFLTDTTASGGAGWTISSDTIIPLVIEPTKLKIRVAANSTLDFKFGDVKTGSSFQVVWGDGSTDSTGLGTGIHSHTYSNTTGSSIDYELEYNGGTTTDPCTYVRFDDNGDAASRNAIVEVSQWGSTQFTNLQNMFRNLVNNDVTATDTPNLSNATSLSGMFQSNQSLVNSNGSIGDWDISNINNITFLFFGANSFNVDISKWDTSSCYSFYWLFKNATSFNQDVSTKYVTANDSPTGSAYWAWNTSLVGSMQHTFYNASSFAPASGSNPGIYNWNTSSVVDMKFAFYSSSYSKPLNTALIQAGSSPTGNSYVAWDVGNVATFESMFNSSTFNSDISKWKLKSGSGKVVMLKEMFRNNTTFNQDISTKTIAAVDSPYGTQYEAWNIESSDRISEVIRNSGVNQSLNWGVNTSWVTYDIHRWAAQQGGVLSTNNYTDQIVKWANEVNNNSKSPANMYALVGDQGGAIPDFDTTRTYSSGFANAGRARSYLSLDVRVSGATGYNGTYYYNYETERYVNENDSTYEFRFDSEEGWQLFDEGGAQYTGGGTESSGPTSGTWTGITVIDYSAGWSFDGALII
jgi:hypothetical protein